MMLEGLAVFTFLILASNIRQGKYFFDVLVCYTSNPVYVHIYLFTYLPTYLPTYLSTYLPTYLSIYLSIYL